MHAFRRFDQLADHANSREWLFRILNKLYVDRRRRRGRQPVDAAVLDRSRDNSVNEAVRRLPEHLRMAVYLADVEGFSYRDIAGITDTTVATVTSRLHSARSRLRELLATVAG